MASIPLPALHVEVPQQQDQLSALARAMQIKSAMQGQQLQQGQLQLQQQQIKDQQATTAALKAWDGHDYDALAKSVLDNGGSSSASIGIQQHGLAVKKQVSDIAAQDATTGSKNLETFIGKHTAIGNALEGLKNVPDEQLHAAALGVVTDLTQNGIFDPQTAQKVAQGIQSMPDPKALREQIDIVAKSSMGAKAAAEQAAKESETQKNAAQAGEATANTNKTNAVMDWYKRHGGAPGVSPEEQGLADWMQKNPGKGPSDYQIAMKKIVPAYNFNLQNQGAVGENGQPSAVAKALADGSMKWQDFVSPRTPMAVKTAVLAEVKQLNPNFNSGDFEVEKKVREKFTSGNVSDQLMAINTAREHMKTFSKLADALDNGDVQLLNKLGNTFGIQFGSDKATNFRIAQQAFGGEVGRAFDGAGVVAGEREQAQKAYTDALSKGQFKGAVGIVDELLAGKQRSAQASYKSGTQGQPNFGSEQSQQTPALSGSGKTLTSAQIAQAAKDNGVTIEEATRQAKAKGYQVSQ